MNQARDETDLQSELDSAKQEIAKLQDELIKAEVENKLRQQFNMPPMQKVLMQGKRARGEELDQEVSCFFFNHRHCDHVLLPAGEQEEEGGDSKSGEAHRQMIQ